MTITSVGYDGQIDEQGWASLSEELGAAYSVKSPDDLKVTVVPAVDRTISIGLGVGYGRGVQDTISGTPPTVQLPVVASGTRWDTIVAHRDWQPPGGLTTLVALTGTATQAVAASRLTNPGVTDDQLLALVQVTAGQQLPTAIVDLRTWSSKVVTASSLLALPDAPLGKEVVIDGARYRRQLDGTGNLAWVGIETTIQGFTSGVPNSAGYITCAYGKTFLAAPVPVVSNGSVGALMLAVGGMRTTGCDVMIYDPAGVVIKGGQARRIHWSVTGVLA